jgi:hypothetical protein
MMPPTELLREAFEPKVDHELRPDSPEQAVRIFAACMEPSRALVALDERQGFALVRTVHSGLLTAGGGYRAVHFMRRPLP